MLSFSLCDSSRFEPNRYYCAPQLTCTPTGTLARVELNCLYCFCHGYSLYLIDGLFLHSRTCEYMILGILIVLCLCFSSTRPKPDCRGCFHLFYKIRECSCYCRSIGDFSSIRAKRL
jgi:hypothetical protein